MAQVTHISIKPGQVILPACQISIETDASMRQDSATGAFQVLGINGAICLSRECKLATWMPLEDMPEGKYTLRIGELLFSNGEVSKQIIEVSFFFVNSKARIPKNLTVYYLSRIAVGQYGIRRLPLSKHIKEKYVEVVKAIRTGTDKLIELTYDSAGNPVNLNKIFSYENRANRAAQKWFVRVDVTEEFPFLVSPMQEYFER